MKAVIKIIKTCFSVLLIGGLGVFFCQTDAGNYIEEEIGLDWLFRLRGSIAPPDEVIIVSIDRDSAQSLHFPDDPENWPRSYYTELIRKINQQQPSVIAFNLHFSESRDSIDDQLLAKAMSAKKNVVLSNYLKQDSTTDQSPIGAIYYEPIIEPIPLLKHAALMTAPFPLPKTSSTVKEFWKYSSGSLPTFPVCIFQYFVLQQAYPEIRQLLAIIDPENVSSMPKTFAGFKKQGSPFDELQGLFQESFSKDEATLDLTEQHLVDAHFAPDKKRLLRSWLALLRNEEKQFLNHYGDVGTIRTIPFAEALADKQADLEMFKDKIILIGYSENIEPEKYQGLYTTFSTISGKVISPIEIAATAVANMLDGAWLIPFEPVDQMCLVMLWGVMLSLIFRTLSYKFSMSLTMLLLLAYLWFCRYLFESSYIWMPLVIPVLQAIIVLLWQSATYIIRLRQVSGSHLPPEVIDEITRKGKIEKEGILMHGVCLATDIDQYTSLSEDLGSRQIAKLINNYNAVTYPRITARKGLILNNIGDAILAGWVSKKIDSKLRRDACHAALEIKEAVERFNKTSVYPLQTRIGLHYGDMEMSFVGADGRFEYRAVGDTVNTATRIEGLNKMLGTRILVSTPVIEGLPDFLSRELGAFLLKGKKQVVTVYELMGIHKESQNDQRQNRELLVSFNQALALFKEKQWQASLEAFSALNKIFPDDGPTLFYLKYLRNQPFKTAGQQGGGSSTSNEDANYIDIGKITT